MTAPIWTLGLIADDPVSVRVLIAWYRGARDARGLATLARCSLADIEDAMHRLEVAGLINDGDPPENAVIIMTQHTRRLLNARQTKRGKK